MTVVSSKDFISNEDKYFAMALDEQVYIQKGSHLFMVASADDIKRKYEKPRQGWAEAAKEFVKSGNEEIFFPDVFEDEDLSWWQWEQK